MRHGLANRLHRLWVVNLLELSGHRFDREGHIGSGISIGDWIDIEAIHHFLVRAQQVAKGPED